MDRPYVAAEDAAALHAALLTLDSHIDIPWPPSALATPGAPVAPAGPAAAAAAGAPGSDALAGSPASPSRPRHARRVDLTRMHAGRLRAGCFAAYVPQGREDAQGNAAARDRALAMLAAIRAMGEAGTPEPGTAPHGPDAAAAGHQAASSPPAASRPADAHPAGPAPAERRPAGPPLADPDWLGAAAGANPGPATRLCSTADAIEAAHAAGAVAVIPCVENGAALGGELATLERFQALGAIYLTLSHNGHNALCDSSNPRADLGDAATRHGGLSGFGREAIAELNRLGMLVDVSHVSRDAMLQAVQCSRTPVVATHSCVRTLCDVPRNLDDAQIDALAASGGLVQITAVPSFLRRHGRADQVRVADYVEHVAYVAQRVGVAHVGISSDFDGGGGFTGWADPSESANLTAGLLAHGFSAAEVAALWGGNFLRLLRAAEAARG